MVGLCGGAKLSFDHHQALADEYWFVQQSDAPLLASPHSLRGQRTRHQQSRRTLALRDTTARASGVGIEECASRICCTPCTGAKSLPAEKREVASEGDSVADKMYGGEQWRYDAPTHLKPLSDLVVDHLISMCTTPHTGRLHHTLHLEQLFLWKLSCRAIQLQEELVPLQAHLQ